jgi:glycosyltransferase involved in cell wall biosynthesis
VRVALVHPVYWPEVRRGSERVVHDLAVGLTEMGHDVTVLTTHLARSEESREEGFRVVRSRRPPKVLGIRRGERFMETVPSVVWHLARGRFDVAHAFFPTSAWGAIQAQRFGGAPVVFSGHGVLTPESLAAYRLRLPMLKRVLAGAAATTVLSQAAADSMRRHLSHNPEVIPPGVFVTEFDAKVERDADPTLVCAASPNDPRKRLGLVLSAFTRLRQARPGARLLMVARPDPGLDSTVQRLPEGAEWLSTNGTADLARAYSRAWASVLAAVDEAFGLVLIESLAAGTPVVAARSGGCPDIVNSDSIGRLFTADDEDDLVRAMDATLDLAAQGQDTEMACRRRAQDFDWSVVLGRYVGLYEEAQRTATPARNARP